MMSRCKRVLATLLWSAPLAACADGRMADDAEEAGSAAPFVAEIHTTDFAFSAPDSLPAGMVTLRMLAGGNELHHVQVVRIEEGRAFDDLVAELARGEGPPPGWVRLLGGVNGADPGGVTETSLHLDPGDYAFVCFIPSPDGLPHHAKGMIRPFTVTGTAVPAVRPAAAVGLTMARDGFHLSGPVAAGRRTILVENDDDAPHEVIVVRLAEGASAASVLDWLAGGMAGPPPASGVGGTVALERGAWNLIHADLAPGRYALLDLLPNPADGRPNAAHGMLAEFVVE